MNSKHPELPMKCLYEACCWRKKKRGRKQRFLITFDANRRHVGIWGTSLYLQNDNPHARESKEPWCNKLTPIEDILFSQTGGVTWRALALRDPNFPTTRTLRLRRRAYLHSVCPPCSWEYVSIAAWELSTFRVASVRNRSTFRTRNSILQRTKVPTSEGRND